MGGADDRVGDVDPTSHFPERDPVDRPLRKAGSSGEGRLGLVDGGEVLGERHGPQARHIRLRRQVKVARRLCVVRNGYPSGMTTSPRRQKFERWMAAYEAARARLGGLSQSEIARRTEELDDAAVKQRTVGRVAKGENMPGVDTLFALFAAVPEAEDAFEASLAGLGSSESEAASWARVGRQMSELMDLDGAHRLVDALHELAELGPLDTTWPHLRTAAFDRRAGKRQAEASSSTRRKSSG